MPETAQGQGETPTPQQVAQSETPAPPDFDSWLSAQDETVRGLLDGHTKGLRSALDTERANAKSLAKQIKELTGKAEAGSETAKQLAELSGKLETEQRRADFYEAATAAGCRNLKLAWLAAQSDGLSAEQVKAQYPDLFATTRPPATHAGNGAQGAGGGAQKDMNVFIRRAAGRG